MSRDGIGIVYAVSHAISRMVGDIADLRQSVLRGYFTMILLFMAEAVHGSNQPEVVINVGVSGPGVIANALKRHLAQAKPGELGMHDQGSLVLEKLEAMTCVCSVGLDMIALPGSVDAATLAAIIADEMAIGMINDKTTAARLIPVPGKEAGDFVAFGGLFGESAILPVRNVGQSARLIGYGGRIPAPLHSLRN